MAHLVTEKLLGKLQLWSYLKSIIYSDPNSRIQINRSIEEKPADGRSKRQVTNNIKIQNGRYNNMSKFDRSHFWPCPYAENKDAQGAANKDRLPEVQNSIEVTSAQHPVTQESKVRPLPLHTTEDVFNEWGAVLRHQDEIDKKLQQQNYEKAKLRQVNYKKELDKQYQELQNKRKGVLGDQMKKEEELIKYQEKLIDQRAKQEEAKRQKFKEDQKSDAMAGFSDLQVKKQQDKMMRDLERDMQREKVQMEQKLQNDMKHQNMTKKKQEENEYLNILSMQAKERQHKLRQEKDTDKQFGIAESIKLNNEEQARNRFFDKLKKIQDTNDQKHKRLLHYMSQDQSVLSSKKDEATYIKNIEIGEKKAVRKEFSDKQNRDKNMKLNNEMLSKQLEEK